ncbi:MAG: carboxymuconolactone decarboxylase family protein [Aestuariivita sp.]|nr:carboxymuconolactone decarboxylase family protein [Aestuariivita sp.]MCY4346189.1 carboxymuconolactone decarboxylase family protein [Aestuariivita sp.]
MTNSERKAALKTDFIEKRGYWSGFWDGLLELAPDFFENYLNYSAIPWSGGPLEPKVKEFIYTAIDVATTHLYEPGLQIHLENALRYGATPQEIMEVYRLCASMGVATNLLGSHLLNKELTRRGLPIDGGAKDPELQAAFEDAFGYWDESAAAWQRLDPASFVAALETWGPMKDSPLDKKTSAFVMIAVTTAATHLNEHAAQAFIGQALDAGASKEEILEVFQLASVLGMHSCTLGVPILMDKIKPQMTV